MNNSNNLRIKSSYGNKTLDERRDARIADAFTTDKTLQGASTANRAHQSYKSVSSMGSMNALADRYAIFPALSLFSYVICSMR